MKEVINRIFKKFVFGLFYQSHLYNNSGPSSLFLLNRAVYTLTFGIKSKCRPFYLFFLFTKFCFYIDIIYFEAYLNFYVLTIV